MLRTFIRLLFKLKAAKLLLVLATLFHLSTAFASSHFTDKQLEALKKHVGKTYWVVALADKTPLFFSAPSPAASSFRAEAKESFQIAEIVGLSNRTPYYRAKFDSGKEGYISVESFLAEFNSTLVAQDPDIEQKRKAAKEAREESRREAWIRAQPWPAHIKEAALKRQAVLGMNLKETRAALGKPKHVVKLKTTNALIGAQEQWTYENGMVLTFTNGVITRMQTVESKVE